MASTIESLPVANDVQSLSKACRVDEQQQVPEKYLKKNPGEEVVVDCPIPVIDLRKLQDPQSSEEECAKLASVCLDWGLFQVGTPSIFICFVSIYIYIIHLLRRVNCLL